MKLFGNLTIGKRLNIGFGIIFIFFLAASLTGWFGENKINQSFQNLENIIVQMEAVDHLELYNTQLTLLFMDFLADREKGKLDEARSTWYNQFKETLRTKKKEYLDLFNLPADKKLLEKTFSAFDQLVQYGDKTLIPAIKAVKSSAGSGTGTETGAPAASTPASAPTTPQTDWAKIDDEIDALHISIGSVFKQLEAKVDARIKRMKDLEHENAAQIDTIIIIIFIIGTLVILLTIYLTRRSIIVPLNLLVNRTKELVKGEMDMTRRIQIDRNDELGELSSAFNTFIQRLQDIIVRVKKSSDHVYDSNEEIQKGSSDLAMRTSEQAASITETSTTLEEFTSILKQNSDNSNVASSMLETFNTQVQGKKELIENVTATMQVIAESGQKIDKIVNVINDISFQTNLLALNAAVEAARAGEAGRGFAVVASEVRNLAQKTAESSKTIRNIVSQNVESTGQGMELVKETSEFFETIISTVEQMSVKIIEIANGSKEQSTGVEQINQAVYQLEEGITQNAALVEEFTSTSKKLKSGSTDLQELVSRFILNEAKRGKTASVGKPPHVSSLSSSRSSSSTSSTGSSSSFTSSSSPSSSAPSSSSSSTKASTPPAIPGKSSITVPKISQSTNHDDSADDFFASDGGDFEEF